MSTKKEDLTRIEDLQDFSHTDLFNDQEAEPEKVIEKKEESGSDEEEFEESGFEESGFEESSGEEDLQEFSKEESFEPEKDIEHKDINNNHKDINNNEETVAPSPPPALEQQEPVLDSTPLQNQKSIQTREVPTCFVIVRGIDCEEVKKRLRDALSYIDLDPNQFEQGFEMGEILVGHISEYSSVLFIHHIRGLELEIEWGFYES